MSPRPRTVSDEEILAATARAIGRVGPLRLTLAHVAREAGLSPATLIQRFGSKRALLLAFARQGGGDDQAFMDGLRAEGRTPLETARAFLLCFAGLAQSPKEMANNLAFLQIDLTDAAFHRITSRLFRSQHQALAGLLAEAQAEGELGPVDARALARLLLAVVNGSLLTWAVYRDGPAAAWLARDVDLALEPYRSSRLSAGPSASRPPSRRRGRPPA
jgi:AcrR family transcriptional regulator